jgi:hypothetical protein
MTTHRLYFWPRGSPLAVVIAIVIAVIIVPYRTGETLARLGPMPLLVSVSRLRTCSAYLAGSYLAGPLLYVRLVATCREALPVDFYITPEGAGVPPSVVPAHRMKVSYNVSFRKGCWWK